MSFSDFLILVILFLLLFTGVYFIWLNLPSETINFETFEGEIPQGLSEKSTQFYTNMRFTDRSIAYSLADSCSTKKKLDFKRATEILEEKTILSFHESDEPEIAVSCSNIAPEPNEEGHFVAGEGGPATIINASRYAVILLGKVALYRPESCKTPQIALHEILHALGFDHNNNSESIMYPFTNCDQQIDQNIIDQINTLYQQLPNPDLIIESIVANKSGRFLNFEATIANEGLKNLEESSLEIIIENELIKSFPLGELDIGSKRTLTVNNLKIPKNTNQITFQAQTDTQELSKENNIAQIRIGT